jgi:tungstate transport system substrate-binding protein
MNAYVLADRGTWISFRTAATSTSWWRAIKPPVQPVRRHAGEPAAKHPHVKKADAQAFIDWLVGPEGQKAIADYKIDGQQLFFANATDAGA